jgi:hypothetical protein
VDSAAVDSWKLVSLSALPPVALWGLGVAVLVGAVLACLGVAREPLAARKWALWVLRVLAAACAVFFLLEPGLRKVQVARVKNRVAVLVDRSASMTFPVAAGKQSRSQAVAESLAALAPQMEAMKDQFAFEVVGFDPELSPISAKTVETEPARGNKTDLLSTLRSLKASEGTSARKLSGVVLLSDGADNGELTQGLNGRAKQVLEGFGVPVSTVAVGQGGLKDLAIENVKVDDFAFVRNSITAEVEVRARGFSGQATQAVLRREGRIVASAPIRFASDDDVQVAKFTFAPDQTGRFVYTVSAPVFPDEAVTENNTRAFTLKVIRDRVRVLLVAGRPSWDERFLRGLLKQDANVELISFYILRNSPDDPMVGNDELSLIPFPRDEIFSEKVHTFDLLVILNFNNDDLSISLSQYEDSIKKYLLNGGALASVGGDRSFGDARFTTFADVLPVATAGASELAPFKVRLTPEGARHPITALGTGSVSTEAAWEALPPIPGMNSVRARPGATVLLDNPFSLVDGKNAPLLSIWDYGRGRVMALNSDGSWAWAFTSHAGGAQTRVYERLWGNAVRWLVRDPELTAMAVTADSPTVEPGKPVGISAIARSSDFQPVAGAQVTIELISADDGRIVAQQTVPAGPDGTAHVEFPSPPAGPYKVVGRAAQGEKVLGEMSDAIAVRASGRELSDARVNAALLEDIAKATGGAFFEGPSFSLSDVPFKEPPLVEVGRSRDQPLWDRWYWLTVMVLILGAEWALRRRFGYI